MIIINFKNYVKGNEVLKLSKEISKYCKKAIICVPTTELKEVSKKSKLKVFAQHIHYKNDKRATGYNTPESIKLYAKGSLLNHSEHKISFKKIKETMNNSKGLKIIICTSSLLNVKRLLKLKPYAIAYEDPKLIASGKSITKYNARKVKTFAKLFKNTKIIPLCGAGINSSKDYVKALDLGCKGILIASAIAKNNPKKLLKEVSAIGC